MVIKEVEPAFDLADESLVWAVFPSRALTVFALERCEVFLLPMEKDY
ncbi:MAG: hypothetical protein ACI9XZ_004280 [Alphaproteobacteria bacterium]|jgi:hypothetical protein